MVIVGGIINKNDKYLLVQEAQESCRGKWNIPAGHLDFNENIFEGAKREIFEECGYKVELTGIAEVANRVMPNNFFISILFSTKIVAGDIKFNTDEILDVRWFSYEELVNMKNELRSYDHIINAITKVEKNEIGDIDLVKIVI